MDFQGQKAAELWISRVLVAFAAVGFLAGYLLSNFLLMVYINVVGLAVTLLLVVPDWPVFNKHPLQWLPPLNPGKTKKEEESSSPTQQLVAAKTRSRKA
jgi:signal peptidase complex subunit 1